MHGCCFTETQRPKHQRSWMPLSQRSKRSSAASWLQECRPGTRWTNLDIEAKVKTPPPKQKKRGARTERAQPWLDSGSHSYLAGQTSKMSLLSLTLGSQKMSLPALSHLGWCVELVSVASSPKHALATWEWTLLAGQRAFKDVKQNLSKSNSHCDHGQSTRQNLYAWLASGQLKTTQLQSVWRHHVWNEQMHHAIVLTSPALQLAWDKRLWSNDCCKRC